MISQMVEILRKEIILAIPPEAGKNPAPLRGDTAENTPEAEISLAPLRNSTVEEISPEGDLATAEISPMEEMSSTQQKTCKAA